MPGQLGIIPGSVQVDQTPRKTPWIEVNSSGENLQIIVKLFASLPYQAMLNLKQSGHHFQATTLIKAAAQLYHQDTMLHPQESVNKLKLPVKFPLDRGCFESNPKTRAEFFSIIHGNGIKMC